MSDTLIFLLSRSTDSTITTCPAEYDFAPPYLNTPIAPTDGFDEVLNHLAFALAYRWLALPHRERNLLLPLMTGKANFALCAA